MCHSDGTNEMPKANDCLTNDHLDVPSYELAHDACRVTGNVVHLDLCHKLVLLLVQEVLERLEAHPALLPVTSAQALKSIINFLQNLWIKLSIRECMHGWIHNCMDLCISS